MPRDPARRLRQWRRPVARLLLASKIVCTTRASALLSGVLNLEASAAPEAAFLMDRLKKKSPLGVADRENDLLRGGGGGGMSGRGRHAGIWQESHKQATNQAVQCGRQGSRQRQPPRCPPAPAALGRSPDDALALAHLVGIVEQAALLTPLHRLQQLRTLSGRQREGLGGGRDAWVCTALAQSAATLSCASQRLAYLF